MKLNKILFVQCVLICTFTFFSCEKYDELFPEEYHQVLNIKNSGISNIQLYTTETETIVPVSIMKTGSKEKSKSDGLLSSMNSLTFEEFCKYNDVHYEYLPENCYSLKNNQLNFTETERYKIVDVIFKTKEIKQLIDNGNKEYALPLLLSSSESNVKDSLLILSPKVMVPTIGFMTSGFIQFAEFTESDVDVIEKNIDISMPVENKWDLKCTISCDEKAKSQFEIFNIQNNNRYKLLPENSYELSGNGVINFPKESTKVSVNLKIDRSKLSVGEYILPLSIADPTVEGFEIDNSNSVILLNIIYSPDKINLKENQLSANSIHPGDGTELKGLIDGLGEGKHFHSLWSDCVVDADYGNYIDVSFESSIKAIKFDYWTRFENGNGAPTHIKLFVSSDKMNWNLIGEIISGLPNGGNQKYSSQIYTSDTDFSYFRFAVVESVAGNLTVSPGTYFNLGELTLYGK